MMTRSLAEMDRLITAKLHEIRALPFDVIVHLPRSGTLPAAIIATYLRKPLASVEEFCRDIISTRKCDSEATSRALLVDDSIRTGGQMKAALARIAQCKPRQHVETLAVFSTRVPRSFEPSLILSEHSDRTYIYPWFMWKTKRVSEVAFDMDGVFCRDCTRDEDDDGPRYAEFLRTASPKFLTSFKVGSIITSRLEKYRPETEAWLAAHGITYGRLCMGPWATPEERHGHAAEWKARCYAKSGALLYVESHEREARRIAEASGLPVWSIETQTRIES